MDKELFLNWCSTKRHLVANSMKHTRVRYDVLFRWLNGKPLDQNSVQSFILCLKEKRLAPATINSYIRVINLIDIYERDHNKDLNLLKEVEYEEKTRRTPTIWTRAEVDALLTARVPYANRSISGEMIDRTYHLITYVILATGCRLDEALGVTVGDFIFNEESTIAFRNNKYRFIKNKLERQPPIPRYPLLEEHLKGRDSDGLAFTNSKGNKIPAQNMERDWALRKKVAGITRKGRLHDCRNTFIMEHIRNNTQLLYLTTLVGHKDPKTTLWYTQFNQEELQKAARNHYLHKIELTLQQKYTTYREKLEALRSEMEHDKDLLNLPIKQKMQEMLDLINGSLLALHPQS